MNVLYLISKLQSGLNVEYISMNRSFLKCAEFVCGWRKGENTKEITSVKGRRNMTMATSKREDPPPLWPMINPLNPNILLVITILVVVGYDRVIRGGYWEKLTPRRLYF